MGALSLALAFAQLLPQLAAMAETIINEIEDAHPAAPIGDTMVKQLQGAANTASALAAAAGKA